MTDTPPASPQAERVPLVPLAMGLVITVIAGFVVVKYAIKNGEKPLAPGRYDDLPSVLKALYLQQKFADFAVEAQGIPAQDLHDRFGAFLEQHKPGDRSGPTQPPGVVRTPSA